MEPHPLELGPPGGNVGRMSLYHRLLQMPSGLPLHRRPESLTREERERQQENLNRERQELRRKASTVTAGTATTTGSIRGVSATVPQSQSGTVRAPAPILSSDPQPHQPPTHITLPPPSPTVQRRLGNLPSGVGYTPIIEHVNEAAKAVEPIVLPASLAPDTRINVSADEFTRAVAVATVSALRQGAADAGRLRASGVTTGYESHGGGGHDGGHDAPSWSRFTSATVLLSCTLLYAIIAGMFSLLLQ